MTNLVIDFSIQAVNTFDSIILSIVQDVSYMPHHVLS